MRTQKETDLHDLIKRLRDHGENAVSYPFHKSRELSRDAAYEVERLRARVAELEGDLDSAEEYICELKTDQEGEL